jgi:hypothetical protein
MGGKASVAAATAQIEDWGQLNTFLGEVSRTKGFTGSLARAVSRSSTKDGAVGMGPADTEITPKGGASGLAAAKAADDEQVEAEPADLIVVAGGNLALIYFHVSTERLTLEAIEEAYPDLVDALANHPGIGVLMVRSAAHGLICVGRKGIHFVDEERIEGEDPLAVYGELAVAAFKRLDGIAHVGDVAVVSQFDPDTQEIAAFEELIGAHGGLGGAQTRPFLLYPADWELDQGPLIGAPMVYRQLRAWMERELGMTFGLTKAGAGRVAPSTDAGAPTPASALEPAAASSSEAS